MNYTIMQQYVYYRVAKDLGLPVEYMMEESGGCGEMASNGTNVFVDTEKKVDETYFRFLPGQALILLRISG